MEIILLILAYILGCVLSFWKFLGLTNHLHPYYKGYGDMFTDPVPIIMILGSWFGLIVQIMLYILCHKQCPYFFKFYLKDRR